jgi:putative flippase GtrA
MKALLEKYRGLILYVVFGVLTTAINIAVYALCYRVLRLPNVPSNVVAWILTVLFAFVTNKIWVFESKSWKPSVALKEFWLFVAARLITGVLEWFGVPLLVAIGLNQPLFGAEGFVAKLVVSVIVVILNYVFSKLIIFKDKKEKPEKRE